jgi:hypothetical protein
MSRPLTSPIHERRGAEMSQDAERFLEALHDYLVPLIGPVATGLIGFVIGHKKTGAEANKIDAEADKLGLDAITSSFQTLIDGYEKRIEDLTNEVSILREEVKSLRKALDKRAAPSSHQS